MGIFISLPIFFIVFGGWLLRKKGIINDNDIRSLNSFAYYVSLPALIAVSLWNIDFLNGENWRIIKFSFFTIASFSLILLLLLSVIKINKDLKAAIFLTAVTGNTIYMGFPLIELSFGKGYLPAGTLIGTIYLIIPLLISIFVIRYWHNREHKLSKELAEFVKNPLIISTVAGIALSFLKIDFPAIDGFKKSLLMLGATASPVALFVLGGFLYGKFLKKDLGLVACSSILKLAAFPVFIAAVYFYLFKVSNFQVAALLASMPTAVTTFVISEKFKLNSALVGNVILASTILSFIVVPLIVYLF
mgnify:CR=1 FL=1